MPEIGSNGGDEDWQRRLEQMVEQSARSEKEKAALAELIKDAESAGYGTAKAIKAVLKSKVKGAKWHADQLSFEIWIGTLRKGAGLPTDLDEAQKAAREEAAKMPAAEEDHEADDAAGSFRRKGAAAGGQPKRQAKDRLQ